MSAPLEQATSTSASALTIPVIFIETPLEFASLFVFDQRFSNATARYHRYTSRRHCEARTAGAFPNRGKRGHCVDGSFHVTLVLGLRKYAHAHRSAIEPDAKPYTHSL